jgi:uncharacterized protein (UPF0333 family)
MARSSLLFALILVAMVIAVGYAVSCCLDKVVTAASMGCF